MSESNSIIKSDKTKLTKILSNLIENALKYTFSGYIELGYSLKNETIEIYLKDTGIGISPSNQKKIFERFSQEINNSSENQGGLGLGLSIAKENAELIGGSISLESEKGKGSTFYIQLPYKPELSSIDSLNGDNNDLLKANLNQPSILIVEDEEVNFLFIEAILKNIKDYSPHILHAKNGKEAVDICSNNDQIDLVLMDIKMPIMNGFEATKTIKKIRPDLPIIAQTAYSAESDKQKALKTGCNDFITKPIGKDQLSSLVKMYIKLDQ